MTPEQVDRYTGLLAAPWDELSERILRDMVRRILKAGRVTSTAEWQMLRAEALGASRAYLIQQMNDKLVEHKQYINEYGVDLPEIEDWKW